LADDLHKLVQKHYVESLKIPYLGSTEPVKEVVKEEASKVEAAKPETKS
jgi:hypothetical protein